jgi:hypothetical protein
LSCTPVCAVIAVGLAGSVTAAGGARKAVWTADRPSEVGAGLEKINIEKTEFASVMVYPPTF